MKKNTFFLRLVFTTCLFVSVAFSTRAQTMGLLYGIATDGGDSGDGVMFYNDIINSVNKVVYTFGKTVGSEPCGHLIQATDGNFYGMTSAGGTKNFGTIYKYNPSTNTHTVLYNFDSVHGKSPDQSLFQASDGNLYGLVAQGGTYNDGLMFKITTSGTYTVLLNFTGTSGSYIGATPYGNLMEASDGDLYGTTTFGGTSSDGVVFKYTLAGVYSVLVNFTGSTGSYLGAYPRTTLVQETSYGYLYGTTWEGGSSNDGTVFYVTTSGTFSNVITFTGVNGQFPMGQLVEVVDPSFYHYFYGLTYLGGSHNLGTIFNFQAPPAVATANTVLSLSSSAGGVGDYPGGGLILASNDSLYGTSYAGSSGSGGSVFQWDFSANVAKVIDAFNGTNGADPDGTDLIEAMTVTITDATSNCTSQTLTAVVRGGTSPYTYFWTGGLTTSSISNITAAGTYTVAVKDSKGITVTQSITLGAYTALNATAYEKRTSCNGTSDGQAAAAVTGGVSPYTYSWSPSGATTQIATGLSAQGYTVTVTDALNCKTTTSVTVQQPSAFSITNTPASAHCYGSSDGSATAIVAGGTMPYSYFWSPGADTTATASGLSAQQYTLTVKDSSGCEVNNSVTVGEPAKLADSVGAIINVSCNSGANGSAKAFAYGGTSPYTYSWSNGTTTSTINAISAGTYTVTVNDANVCGPVTTTVTINEPTQLNSSISSTNVSCKGGNNGNATEAASGGKLPYSYLWNIGGTGATLSNLVAGTYSVVVTDKNGCTINSTSVVVSEPSTLLTVDTSGVNVSCYAGNNGSVAAIVKGGNTPYMYNWTGGATSSSINNLVAGTYTVSVTDSNGCVVNNSYVVTQPNNSIVLGHVCMVTVDTGSVHNIITWDKTGLTNIKSIKVYYYNSSNSFMLLANLPFSNPGYYVDTASINNPNMNTVRYCITAVDSCGNEEAFTSSPWQNTMHILNIGGGTFSWSGTGYLIQNDATPVQTYYLKRDNNSNGNWISIDSVSGTQNTMTDPNYGLYPNARWRVDAELDVSGCNLPLLRPYGVNYNATKSNTGNITITDVKQIAAVNKVSVYPNPASQDLNIRFDNVKTTTVNIKITDVTGRILSSIDKEINPGMPIQISVSDLSAGVYFVKVANEAVLFTQKFVKE